VEDWFAESQGGENLIKFSPLINTDALGRQSAVVDALGQRSTTEYDKRGLVVANVDALGHRSETTYDALGRAVQSYNASRKLIAVWEYDALGRTTRTSDALSNSQSYAYDARGLLISTTDALGGVALYEYDALGRQSALVDELGHRSETRYDAAGRVVKTIGAAGALNAEAVTVYDAAGRVVEERDALGHATHYEHGRMTATVGPNGQRSTMEYDAAGRVVALVDALGHRTQFTLDANGNQLSETDALGHVTGTQYDALDRPIATIDANGVRRETIYDAIGQVVGAKDGRGNLTQMSYDTAGRRTAVTDAKGHATTYVYNERDELTQETDALGQSLSSSYTATGQLFAQTDAKRYTGHRLYDKLSRVVLKHFADGAEVKYVYDAVGNLTRMTDSIGITDTTYDALNRDLSVRYASGHQLTYQLDIAGRRLKMTDPDGGDTLYAYDESDRLTQLTNPQGEVTGFVYDALDRVVQKTLANGVVETHTFDVAGRETLIVQRTASGALLSSFASVYDNVGQRTQVTEADGSVMAYTYDADGQLLSETRTGTRPYARTYSYDKVGNRTSKVEAGLTTTYVYDVANQLLSQETRDTSNSVVSQGTSNYDPNGCLLQQVQDGATTSYAWNAQSFLIQTISPSGQRETYSYCGEGIRRKTQSNAGTRLFIRDGKNILLEADASNSTLRRYTHMSDYWGELISLRQGSTSRFYGFDGSANTRLLTDANAGVSDAYLYSAFGEELRVTGSSVNPLRFGGEVGYYRDTAKRVYVRARHLDVGAGRWMSRDPIGFKGGDWNFYGYVQSSPLNRIDPFGLYRCDCCKNFFAFAYCCDDRCFNTKAPRLKPKRSPSQSKRPIPTPCPPLERGGPFWQPNDPFKPIPPDPGGNRSKPPSPPGLDPIGLITLQGCKNAALIALAPSVSAKAVLAVCNALKGVACKDAPDVCLNLPLKQQKEICLSIIAVICDGS